MQFIAHDYQQYCIDKVIDQPYIGLFLDMGLGKTVITLTALNELKEDYLEDNKTLVIAPKRVAEDTWPREHLKWDHLKNLEVVPITGSPKKRLEALDQEGDIYIITRDLVAWLVEVLGDKWPFSVVVIDELSSFKNHQSKRFKALRKVRPLMDRVVGLTGTPAPNGYLDLWSQIYLLDRGKRLGPTVTSYRREYFIATQLPGFVKYDIRKGAEECINYEISDLCVSMKAKDYLSLKEPTYIEESIKLSPKEMKEYKAMEKDYVLDLGDETISAFSAAAVTTKLLQLANGAIYNEEGQYRHIHDKKLEALAEIVEASQGEPLLVFYSFKSDLVRLLKAFPEARKLENDKDIKDWNDKKIPMLLAHPASAGHGLNLQEGGSIIVWFGPTWSLELYQQANARLHRQGQKEAVRIYHLIAEGTMDERVMSAIERKDLKQEDLLRQLKAEIDSEGVRK